MLRKGLFFAEKRPCVLGDGKTGSCFLFHKGAKVFVPVQKILILISMAGEDIFDERFRAVHQQRILIAQQLNP